MKKPSVTHLMNAFGHAFGFTPGSNLSLNIEKLISKMFIQGRATLLTQHVSGEAVSLSLFSVCGLPWLLSGKEYVYQYRRHRFGPWVGKISWKKEMAIYSSILAWEIPRTEEPGWLQSLGSQELDTT